MCVLYLLHIYSVCSQHQSLMFNTCSREVTSWSFLLSKKADFLITVISSSSKPRAKCKTSLESWKSFFNGRKARKHGTRFWGWQWLAQRLRQCREHDWGTGRDYETCRRGPTCVETCRRWGRGINSKESNRDKEWIQVNSFFKGIFCTHKLMWLGCGSLNLLKTTCQQPGNRNTSQT